MTEFSKWERSTFDEESAEIGVKISDFANAIQVYVMMQQARPVSVADLIRVFNTDRASVLDAIEEGYWLFIVGPDDDDTKRMVEVDGE